MQIEGRWPAQLERENANSCAFDHLKRVCVLFLLSLSLPYVRVQSKVNLHNVVSSVNIARGEDDVKSTTARRLESLGPNGGEK